MNRLKGKVALITGASSGIGRAVARQFAEQGVHLVLTARRRDRLETLATELEASHGVRVRVHTLDVRDREGVLTLARDLESEDVEIDILVNNAGLARGLATIQEGDFDAWDEMIDTNVKGVLNLLRAFVPGMVKRDRGHVVNVGSIAGHQVYPKGNVYNASKFAVRAINEALALDVVGTKIRVTSIDPGLVETEFSEVRFYGDSERAQQNYQGYTPLKPEDVADTIVYATGLPEHVNVLDLVLLPTDQRNAYVVHKEGV